MSTDLGLLQDLAKTKLPKLIIPTSNQTGLEIQLENKNQDDSSSAGECLTPTSEENKIPAVLSCPGAPRKPRRTYASCKRKLSEFQFFEILNRDEVDAFFEAGFHDSISKRRIVFGGRLTCGELLK
ncbi:LOSS OF GIANT CELLS FROM ORGANS, SIAMESE RELATED 1 [Hibiscus trionum]|uniref:LOSS OF GIANT CELLS FROM ORGANS, SIAMESE RELATED 1 n=1 Tax=Hibiscus trionum TaxID=183268 RepID=A0A9W7JDW1_HIBTR|nr:LOSS OF GIANT CELLS FROM ORGANS, SIAMESE RELATED 1 [Hibiscus trionum]